MERFRRLLEWTTRIEIVASVISLAAICLLTLATLTARQLPSVSILWAEEVSLLLMKVVAFVGAAAMYATKTFIAVDGLYDRIPERSKSPVYVAGWLVIAAFALVMATQGMLTYPRQIAVRSYLLEWPKFYFTVPLIIGGASIFATSIYYILEELRVRLNGNNMRVVGKARIVIGETDDTI